MRYLVASAVFLVCIFANAQNRQIRATEKYEEALEAFRDSKYAFARKLLDESIELRASSDAHYLRGLAYVAEGKDLRAVASFEAAVALDPNYHEAYFQKGVIYLQYHDPSQAIKDFTFLIDAEQTETRSIYFQIDPSGDQQTEVGTLQNFKAQLYHYRGQAHRALRAYDQSFDDLARAIAIDRHPDYYVTRALLYQKTEQSNLAVRDLHQAVALDSLHQLAWYNLVLLDPDVQLPEGLMETDGAGATIGLLASRALEQGDFQRAKVYFDRSLERNPMDVLTRINRGRVLLKIRQFDAAIEDFELARKQDHTRFETLYLIGNGYFFQKRHEIALAYYHQYLAVDPANAMVWYNAAMCQLELKQKEDACHSLERAQTLGMLEASGKLKKYCR